MDNSVEKMIKIQQDNPNRYCDLEKYNEGIVCFIDILGFGNFIKDHFAETRDLFNEFVISKIGEETALEIFQMSIASDSILLTVKENVHFELEMLIRKIMYLRMLVIKKIGTDIRAGITYGEYVHCGYKDQLYFGPAINKAVEIAEKCGTVSCKYGKIYQPAGVYLDYSLFAPRENNRMFIGDYSDFCIDTENNFYIINPYEFEYKDKWEYFIKLMIGKVKNGITKYNYWMDYYRENYKNIMLHNAQPTNIKKKYQFHKKMLKDFKEKILTINKDLKM